MPTYRLTIEYDGTRYSGWQTQMNAPRTIQGALLRAAAELVDDADIGGAGRTDAGVHALAQVAHFRTRFSPAPAQLRRDLNDLLPHDIHVLRVEEAPRTFHARHDAIGRVYLYQISRRRSAFAKPYVWWIKDALDAAAMGEAARSLVGRHDYAALTDRRANEGSTIVVVERAEIAEDGDLILFRIEASHFLWKMVRKTVAVLADVGRGSLEAGAVAALLEPGAAPWEPSAPGSGLFLESVLYPGESLQRPLRAAFPVTDRSPSGESWASTNRR